jgi:hypothetical protein
MNAVEWHALCHDVNVQVSVCRTFIEHNPALRSLAKALLLPDIERLWTERLACGLDACANWPPPSPPLIDRMVGWCADI